MMNFDSPGIEESYLLVKRVYATWRDNHKIWFSSEIHEFLRHLKNKFKDEPRELTILNKYKRTNTILSEDMALFLDMYDKPKEVNLNKRAIAAIRRLI